MGAPSKWHLANLGKVAIQMGKEEVLSGGWIALEGAPDFSIQGPSEVTVAALIQQGPQDRQRGEVNLITINLEAKLDNHVVQGQLGRYLQATKADWTIATEVPHAKKDIKSFRAGTQYRQPGRPSRLGYLPPGDDPIWDVFRQRLAQLLQQATFQGEEPGEILAAWDIAARATLPMTKGGKYSTDPIKQGVSTLLPLQVWGIGRIGGKQMWQTLQDMREKVTPKFLKLQEDGRQFTPEEVLAKIQQRWGEVYQHPKSKQNWCGQDEWERRLKL
eukprot:gene7130-966_t